MPADFEERSKDHMKALDKVRNWFRRLGSDNNDTGSKKGSQPAACPAIRPEGPSQPQVQQAAAAPTPAPAPAPAQPVPQRAESTAASGNPVQQQQQHQQQQQQQAPQSQRMVDTREFFEGLPELGESNRFTIKEVVGKGSYGVVCSAVDNYTGEKVAIKKITNVFEHVSDATRILREIKLLRLLKHPDIVEIKHIMLPPSPREYKDIYVVFELLETDLHQVIKANDDLTPEHHQFFLYQMLRGMKYIHSAKVFHRDLKPKNILANSDCKLKICDFGLARPAFSDQPSTIFWTDYVATRWYRAPELCGSFYAKYSPAIDIWSIGCIFAEVLLGKPLFPGRNVVHQLELITDLLGTPSPEVINKVRNEKARRFLSSMRWKSGVPFEQVFPTPDMRALALLKRLLAFDPAERPSAEEALADPYFEGLHSVAREPVAPPISKMAFDFDRRKLAMEDVRELIYREILEYHPQVLHSYTHGVPRSSFAHPSALEHFKRQFMHLEGGGAPGSQARGHGGQRIMQSTSLPKEMAAEFQAEARQVLRQQMSAASRAAAEAAETRDTSERDASSAAGGCTAAAGTTAAAAGSAVGMSTSCGGAAYTATGHSYPPQPGQALGRSESHR